jgi:hypothetical protein
MVVKLHHEIVRGIWYDYEVSVVMDSRLSLGLHANDSIYLACQPEQRRFEMLGGIPN